MQVGFTNKAGRNLSGRRTVLSKGGWANRRVFKNVVTSAYGLYPLGLIIRIEPKTQFLGAVALVKTAMGSWYYGPASQHMSPLYYFAASQQVKTPGLTNNEPGHWLCRLYQYPPHTKISWLSPLPSLPARYALSAGSRCLLVSNSLWGSWSLVSLPSGKAKLIDEAAWALRGALIPAFKRYINWAKASKHLFRGFKPQVRGVAKNPNDHPNGGRTKAIKTPKTPWGRVAKKSRTPSPRVQLKALSKRASKNRPGPAMPPLEDNVQPADDLA